MRFPSPRRCSLRRPTWPPRRRARPGSRRVPPRLLCGEQQQEQAIGSNCMCAAQACATPKEQAALAPVKAGVAKRSQRIAAKQRKAQGSTGGRHPNQHTQDPRPLLRAHGAYTPRCQVEGCTANLTRLREYYQRYHVCEHHSKQPSISFHATDGGVVVKRFCQRCGRFQEMDEFEGSRRSCRAALNEHNRRRRTPDSAPPKKADAAPVTKAKAAGRVFRQRQDGAVGNVKVTRATSIAAKAAMLFADIAVAAEEEEEEEAMAESDADEAMPGTPPGITAIRPPSSPPLARSVKPALPALRVMAPLPTQTIVPLNGLPIPPPMGVLPRLNGCGVSSCDLLGMATAGAPQEEVPLVDSKALQAADDWWATSLSTSDAIGTPRGFF